MTTQHQVKKRLILISLIFLFISFRVFAYQVEGVMDGKIEGLETMNKMFNWLAASFAAYISKSVVVYRWLYLRYDTLRENLLKSADEKLLKASEELDRKNKEIEEMKILLNNKLRQ